MLLIICTLTLPIIRNAIKIATTYAATASHLSWKDIHTQTMRMLGLLEPTKVLRAMVEPVACPAPDVPDFFDEVVAVLYCPCCNIIRGIRINIRISLPMPDRFHGLVKHACSQKQYSGLCKLGSAPNQPVAADGLGPAQGYQGPVASCLYCFLFLGCCSYPCAAATATSAAGTTIASEANETTTTVFCGPAKDKRAAKRATFARGKRGKTVKPEQNDSGVASPVLVARGESSGGEVLDHIHYECYMYYTMHTMHIVCTVHLG